jgi:hypothetical protein
MKKRIFLVVVFALCNVVSGSLRAQSKSELEEHAYAAFNDKDYATAYTLFDKLNAKYPKEFDYKFKLGLCCLNYPEKKVRAIEIFQSIKKETTGPEADFYLAHAYHENYRFDEAISLLEPFIEAKSASNKKEDKELVAEAKVYLSNSRNGKFLTENNVKADIINIGPPVNNEEDQYVPAITTDESVMIYTYRGKNSIGGKLNDQLKPDPIDGRYREDVYMTTRLTDSTWSEPKGIASVNTKGEDAAISVSPDGQTLFTFFSTDKNEGDIYVSNLHGSEFSKPEPMSKNINSEFWEGSCSISADGRYLYFASERPGGIGKRDIYVSEKANGEWGPAVNLGPKINTESDDDAPFIHPDGITLFFSSKGHSSIGGYDIMFSVKRDNDWTDPKSMGLPLNTTEDDRYYVINSNGSKGFFSSNRGGSGGFGKHDIYMVTPGILGEKPVIALLKGVVYGDDKPVEATVEVLKIAQKENIGPFISNKNNGKYLMALSPGFVYRIKVVAEGFDPVEEDLDIEGLDKFMETQKDFYLYRPGKITPTDSGTKVVATYTSAPTATTAVETPTAAETPTVAVKTKTTEPVADVKTPDPVVEPCSGTSVPDVSSIKGKSLNDIAVYKQLLNVAGNYCAEGLIFKVQIAAYRKPENYKYDHLKQYGKPEVLDYPDGITRFTQMQFNTIRAAEKQRQKAIAKGQKDAWIVAFVNGKRYTLEDLIMVDFLGKSIN